MSETTYNLEMDGYDLVELFRVSLSGRVSEELEEMVEAVTEAVKMSDDLALESLVHPNWRMEAQGSVTVTVPEKTLLTAAYALHVASHSDECGTAAKKVIDALNETASLPLFDKDAINAEYQKNHA